MDFFHHLLHQPEEIRQAFDLVAHQHCVRRFDGDIRADAAHGDPGIRACQGQRIVYAVANHANWLRTACVFLYDLHFLFGKKICPNIVDPDRFGNGPCRLFVVAGEKHGRDPDGLQFFQRLPGVFTQGVPKGDAANERVVRGNVNDGRAFAELLSAGL